MRTAQLTLGVGRVYWRAEIGDRLALGDPSTAVHGQAVEMEGVAGSPRLVRSGAGLPNPGARAQACRPTAGTGRLRAFRCWGMIRRQPAAADAGRWALADGASLPRQILVAVSH